MTTLLPATTITTAINPNVASSVLQFRGLIPRNLCLQATFVYGSGGTSVDAYVQTSLDGQATWFDIANFHFTTANAKAAFNLSSLTPVTTQYTAYSTGAITTNTCKDGLIGPCLRVLYGSVGTYAGGTTLAIYAISPGLTT